MSIPHFALSWHIFGVLCLVSEQKIGLDSNTFSEAEAEEPEIFAEGTRVLF